MILADKLLNATFLERPNRYLAIVELDGENVEAYVPNPGRMKELLIAGVPVKLRQAKNPNRKTAYDLVLVEYQNQWVCIDSQVPNQFLLEFLSNKGLDEFDRYDHIKKEKTYQNSRFDFLLESESGDACYIEAKSCTLVVDGVALFPDAPTKRGARHMDELAHAVKNGFEAYVIIVIQRDDATSFSPNEKTDPDFAEAIRNAVQNGVNVIAITTTINENEIIFVNRVEVNL